MRRARFLAIPLAVLTLAACTTTQGTARAPSANRTEAPDRRPALFYAKGGKLYVSDPAGTPGRKLTDGPIDTQPAPSPDGKRVAYIRQSDGTQPGGELWVLDVVSGAARRLVDPAGLTPRFGADDPQVDSPRWSPSGDRIAFLKSTQVGGGFLQTAAADTGAVAAPPKPMFAVRDYAWSADGRQIAWVGGRSDVRPNDVNVYAVGGSSASVVTGANAFAAAFTEDGSVLFANGQVDVPPSPYANFVLRQGGIYSVTPPAKPQPLLSGPEFYKDVAALASGAVGFTEASADPRSQSSVRTVRVLDKGDTTPRTVGETTGLAQGPVWAGDLVAYIGTDEERPLLIGPTESGGNAVTDEVDAGVDSFAWAG